jgi:uncharacterized metal-binding protein
VAFIRHEVSDRTLFGKIVKWLFILFNLLMIAWAVFESVSIVRDVNVNSMSYAEAAMAEFGIEIAFVAIGTIWVMGDIILGLLVLLTRRKKIETDE